MAKYCWFSATYGFDAEEVARRDRFGIICVSPRHHVAVGLQRKALALAASESDGIGQASGHIRFALGS